VREAKRRREAGTLDDLDLADPYFDPIDHFANLLAAWNAASGDARRRLLIERAGLLINEPLWRATDTPATVAMRIASQLSHGKAKLVRQALGRLIKQTEDIRRDACERGMR
jgi:hypothetical protein